MNSDIYGKGVRLAAEGKVALEAETERAAYYVVEGDSGTHHVRLMRDNTFNCTCLWGSLRGAVYGSLCSHVVAAILSKTTPSALPVKSTAGQAEA